MTPGFRTTDKRVSTLYPTPRGVPVPLPPRTTYCDDVLDAPMGMAYRGGCYQLAGHEGLHVWEMCEATDDLGRHGDGDEAECQRQIGHEPPHRFVHEWEG